MKILVILILLGLVYQYRWSIIKMIAAVAVPLLALKFFGIYLVAIVLTLAPWSAQAGKLSHLRGHLGPLGVLFVAHFWTTGWTFGRRPTLVKVKPSTKLLYEQQIRLYIKPALGKIKLEDLDTDKIQQFYNRLGEERDGKPGLSPKSVRNVHGILHKALQQATKVKTCGIRTNPADGCELPRVEQKEIKPLSEEQLPLFLDAIEGHCHEYIYKVALFTGMREGEVLGLMWDCVDFSRGTITVKRQRQVLPLHVQEREGPHHCPGPGGHGAASVSEGQAG